MNRRISSNRKRVKNTTRSFRLTKRRKAGPRAVRQKPVLKPSDLRKRKRLRQRNIFIAKLTLIVVLILGSVIGLWFVARAESFTIQNVDIRNKGTVKNELIEKHVLEIIERDKGAFFPTNNTFFLSIGALEKSLEETFLKVERAHIIRKGFDELIVVVEERSPELIYCNSSASGERTQRTCYFADDSGIVYADAPYIPRSELDTVYLSREEPAVILGTTPLSKSEILALGILIDTLQSRGVETEDVHLLDDEALRVETDESYSLVVAIDDDYTDELERFFSALEADVFDSERSITDVYEFDLRFGRKVFYKFHDEVAPVNEEVQ